MIERIAAIIVTTSFGLSGCSGKLYTVINPDLDAGGGNNKEVRGVIVYPNKNVVEVTETQALVDDDKNILATVPDCVPKRYLKFSTRPDYGSPYMLVYKPGLLETNKFAVTLNEGTLVSVNTESDPSKMATALAGLLPFAPGIHAPSILPAVRPGMKFCNDLPKLIGVFEAPDILPFDQIPPK